MAGAPRYIREAFSDEEIRQNKELFDSFDEDGWNNRCGVSKLEDHPGCSRCQWRRELIEEIDIDGDGLVDFVEFLTP